MWLFTGRIIQQREQPELGHCKGQCYSGWAPWAGAWAKLFVSDGQQDRETGKKLLRNLVWSLVVYVECDI